MVYFRRAFYDIWPNNSKTGYEKTPKSVGGNKWPNHVIKTTKSEGKWPKSGQKTPKSVGKMAQSGHTGSLARSFDR